MSKEEEKNRNASSVMKHKSSKGTYIVSTSNHFDFKRNVNIKTLNIQHEKKSQTSANE